MSGWIKMGTGLGSHPKVRTMRRALKADRLRVIGALWAVWCVFDEHSADGELDGYTLDDMDDEIGWRGFAAAMRDIGWLVETEAGLVAPDYEEHNGASAKRRAMDASRKGKSRKSESAHEPDDDPPKTRTDVRHTNGHVSASHADKTRNREEKRREEPPSEVGPADAGLSPAVPAPPALTLVPEEAKSGPPPCPHRRLLAIYAAKVPPEMPRPRVELWEGSAGAAAMRERWRWVLTAKRENGRPYASTLEEAVEWFGTFFEKVADSDFLTGRNGKWKGCDLAWLMQRDKFRGVIEGRYDTDRTAA